FREGLAVGREIERRVIKKIVVAKKIAGDRRVGVPAPDILRDRFGPARHEQPIVIAVADPVDAEDIEIRHEASLLRRFARPSPGRRAGSWIAPAAPRMLGAQIVNGFCASKAALTAPTK